MFGANTGGRDWQSVPGGGRGGGGAGCAGMHHDCRYASALYVIVGESLDRSSL